MGWWILIIFCIALNVALMIQLNQTEPNRTSEDSLLSCKLTKYSCPHVWKALNVHIYTGKLTPFDV